MGKAGCQDILCGWGDERIASNIVISEIIDTRKPLLLFHSFTKAKKKLIFIMIISKVDRYHCYTRLVVVFSSLEVCLNSYQSLLFQTHATTLL